MPSRADTAAASVMLALGLAMCGQTAPQRTIVVKAGDTLWSLARTHRIGLNRLRSINHLADDQIVVGQVLLLSESRMPGGASPDSNR